MWLGGCVSASVPLCLVGTIQITVFAKLLSNVPWTLLLTRGGTILILGRMVKGQGQYRHSVYKTLWAHYRLQFLTIHFQTSPCSHASCGWWEEEPYWFWVTGSNLKVKVNVGTLFGSGYYLQRVWHASRERLPFGTPGSVPHCGTCLCSICWDEIPRACHVFTRLFTSNTPWYFLDFASHNCCPWPKNVSWPWPKVISPKSRSQCTHTQRPVSGP